MALTARVKARASAWISSVSLEGNESRTGADVDGRDCWGGFVE